MGKTCEICGANSGMYPLCTKCFKLRDEGKVVKCEKCGAWHLINKPCKCEKTESKTEIKEEPQFTCILCGKEASPGHHFCYECYNEYSNQNITVNIEHCKKAEIIDKYGNKTKKTRSGVYVRSLHEKIISDELFEQNIRCIYEETLPYIKEDGTLDELHPDFYLPDFEIYIEHWGYQDSNDPKYIKTKEYKEKIYKQLNKKVVGTSTKDLDDISGTIKRIVLQNTKK